MRAFLRAIAAMSVDLPKCSHSLHAHGDIMYPCLENLHHVYRRVPVAAAVPRLRRVMYTLFGAVVALPIDVFKCSYSFNAYGEVMSIRFGAIDARSIYLLKCS